MSHSPPSSSTDRDQRLDDVLAHAGHLLPAQGPIGVFVHHNTLHAFQHLPFHEALATASATFETETYLPESRYRELYRRGRINDTDLKAALAERDAGDGHEEFAPPSLSRLDLELLALLHPVPEETAASLRWRMNELAATYMPRPDVPEAARQRFLRRSTEGLREGFNRVARDWTMTDLAVSLLDPSLEATVRAAAAEPGRAMPRRDALRRLGIPDALTDAYVAQVQKRLDSAPTRLTVEGWLGAEVSLAASALGATFGGDGGLRALKERLERHPERFAVSALWAACRAPVLAATEAPPSAIPPAVRSHREALRAATGEDINEWVNPQLIRTCSAYLDEGVSHWTLPEREHGLYAAWRALTLSGGLLPDWLDGLDTELVQSAASHLTARDVVLAALDELGVPETQWEPYLTRVLLALPGWAGMIHRLEHNPADRPAGSPPAHLMDFLAVRLTLERHALRTVARRRLEYRGPLAGLLAHAEHAATHRPSALERPAEEGSWRLFQLLQLAGLSAQEMAGFPLARRKALLAWLDAFDPQARRRVWQEAYEHHYRMDVLQGLAQNRLRPESARTVRDPRFQVIFCMDDREEAIRRHFEELDPRHDTFGIAGFFGVAMDYLGLDDEGHAAMCPVVVTPGHVVEERPHPDHGHLAEGRARLRALGAHAEHWVHGGSHALEMSWLLTPLLGLISALLLPLQVLSPRTVSRMRRGLARKLLPAPRTRLVSLREQAEEPTAASPAQKPLGFTVAEKAARVANSLENMGLVKDFAPLVVVLGHGAISVNNPHQSAYDCGACGGRHGGPNARLFAEMANRPEVRAQLRERGIHIPDTTWFLGGEHNTTTDDIELSDTDAIPPSLHAEFAVLREALDTARMLSAHERCRRFESAPLSLSPAAALRHVEERSADLSQARPELGHVTNATCIVGRRSLSRGLFLDRRAFLISYDPTIDPSGAIAERILAAAGPVGAGINLEYYFSCIDNDRYGCGTKLPHNLTSMLGVMDGVESDLRTGLPRQMIEIHEPIRLLIIVEASVQVLGGIYERQPLLRELIGNQWVQLVSVDPTTGAQMRFTPRGFEPVTPPPAALPVVASSPEWYRGQRDFLPPALIDQQQQRPSSSGESVHARQ